MKISLKWLQDYVDIKDFFPHPEKLGELLTLAGLEIESIDNEAANFQHVVIGQVIDLKQHPQADRLTLCQVDVGEKTPRQIVCGAKNHKQGDKVVVSLPGAHLPIGLTIKESQIRGVKSQGMMCSNSELGLTLSKDEDNGIRILPKVATVGTTYANYEGLDDVIFDLNVTPNRADCLSHLGLAREIACLLDRQVKYPESNFHKGSSSTKETIKVELKSSDLCPRYAGCLVRGVKIGESPDWLKKRLESVGVGSINNIVDITNYVMLELGQPLHAFDINFIEKGHIIIESTGKSEKFKPLYGEEIELSGEELTIRDPQKPLALAGIIGSLNSGVVEQTTDIFIESAHFTQKTVRRTSRQLGVHTDSSYRFCRGTDPEGVVYALKRACHLMEQLVGGEVSHDSYDECPSPVDSQPIWLRHKCLEERLGMTVSIEKFHSWMKRLGCELIEVTEEKSLLKPPTYRWDLNVEIDFVEEYARLNGYDQIPERLPTFVESPTDHAPQYKAERRLARWLCEQGYLQAINYHFTGEKFLKNLLGDVSKLKACGFNPTPQPILISNPLNEESNAMRPSLLPGLIKNMIFNYRHGLKYGRLFEVGNTFSLSSETNDEKKSNSLDTSKEGYEKNTKEDFIETSHLSLMAWGQKKALWNKADQDRPLIYDVKSSMEAIFTHLKSSSFQWKDLKEAPDFLHPSQCAALFFEGQILGFIGTLHPALRDEYKIREDVALGEFILNGLMRGQPRKPKLKELSKYPSVERDFSFVLPNELKVGDIMKAIKKAAGHELQSVEVFDDYRGEEVKEGHRSITFKLVYQDKNDTLSEERLLELHQGMISAINKKFSIHHP